MDFRSRRQFLILFTLAIILAGAGLLIYRAGAPGPTCVDDKKNQGEERVDCGGPCIPCAFRNKKDLEVFWVRAVPTRPGRYDVAVEIKNPNVKVGAARFEFEFTLVDEKGIAVASRRGRSFIYPSEIVHLAEIGLEASRPAADARISLEHIEWVSTDTIAPDVIAGNREYLIEAENGTRQSVVRANLQNRTLLDVPDLTVTALLLDDDGNLLGVHSTFVDRLDAGITRPVEFRWPGVLAESAASVIIEARSPFALPNP